MEPLKPEEKKRILSERRQAAPEEIEEYERLLAERFARDPLEQEALPTPVARSARARDERLRILFEKLFG